jgi:hypothetical protein
MLRIVMWLSLKTKIHDNLESKVYKTKKHELKQKKKRTQEQDEEITAPSGQADSPRHRHRCIHPAVRRHR